MTNAFHLKCSALKTFLSANCQETQEEAFKDGAIGDMLSIVRSDEKKAAAYHDDDDLPEMETVALANLVQIISGNEKNCRYMLRNGLDVLINIAERTLPPRVRKAVKPLRKKAFDDGDGAHDDQSGVEGEGEAGDREEDVSNVIKKDELPGHRFGEERPKKWKKISGSAKTSSEIALQILQLIGPHNWILCTTCGTRNAGGERQCGHKIKFE